MHYPISLLCGVLICAASLAQDQPGSDDTRADPVAELVLPAATALPRCFGFTDISQPTALAVCDALSLRQNVKARELAEQWVRAEPESPAAQFTLAEVLLTVEGNMPRALFHLHQAEQRLPYDTPAQALQAEHLQWHYLTISQLSHIHQLMGDQLQSLHYLDRLETFYDLDLESFRGWPLIKLGEYAAARASANKVLQSSQDEAARSRAWNTLCAAELASLAPVDTRSCERAISEDEDLASAVHDFDTVYLTNASEVALSLLQTDVAEGYLDRATRYLNPDSVADPWIYKLYLTLNQGRFDAARQALERMTVWRAQQQPLISAMNRAEHLLASASFLLIAGYAEDAAKLALTALNQPDRNGAYSADDRQKDAFAALLHMAASRTALEMQREVRATLDWPQSWWQRWHAVGLGLQAWRSERRAASLFARFEVLQNRVRPYAPLDVHIPEWMEPELVRLIGTGVMTGVLEQASANGAFQLNQGYYHAWRTETAVLERDFAEAVRSGDMALSQLPTTEVLLRARIAARIGQAWWRLGEKPRAIARFTEAYRQDPGSLRRLGLALPVAFAGDDSSLAAGVLTALQRSPRFTAAEGGFRLEVITSPAPSVCLRTAAGAALACFTPADRGTSDSEALVRELVNGFHQHAFGLGFTISKAQRAILLGASVYLNPQSIANPLPDAEASPPR